jgi:serine/threonine protein kinase
LAREISEETMTLTGTALFMAPEVNTCFYSTSCDVWSFGIIIGELCEIPGSDLATEPEFKLVEESREDEAYLKMVAGKSKVQFEQSKSVALARVERRLENKEDNFLLTLAKQCLQAKPENRPTFESILPLLGTPELRPNLCSEFKKYHEKFDESRIELQVAKVLRERYKKFKLTSFEWNEGGTSDPSAKMMANAEIETAFVKVLLERETFEPSRAEPEAEGEEEDEEDEEEEDADEEKETDDKVEPKNVKYVEEVELESIWEYNKQEQARSQEKCKRFVIQGKAGAGKTTLLKWMAYQWAIGKLWQDFVLVVHMELKELPNFENLDVILQHATKVNTIPKIAEGLKESKAKILWLMDGWDEIIPSGIIKNIQADEDPNVEWMIAGTRPEASLQLKCDGTLHVQRFSQEGREAYIKNYFKSAPENSKKVQSLLSLSPFLDDACKLPLMLNLLCFASPMLEGEDFTISQIYEVVMSELIERASSTQNLARSKAPKISFKPEKITKIDGARVSTHEQQKSKTQKFGRYKKSAYASWSVAL